MFTLIDREKDLFQSHWPFKFVIGLTGNIATGKSVVRKMLEHIGAFGIDADALANRAIQSGSPGYEPVRAAFGKYVLQEDGEIDRAKLAQIVFADHEALAFLEGIVHPIVRQAVDMLVRKSNYRVVVIEAIKLLESPLRDACDTIWVTTSDPDRQLARLEQHRGMNRKQAEQRMSMQSPQEEKVAVADTVIHNNGSIEVTWEQVKASWKLLFPEAQGDTVPSLLPMPSQPDALHGLRVARARPRHAQMISEFMGANSAGPSLNPQQVMDTFGEKAYLLLESDDGIKGLLGWKVENLVARVDDIFLASDLVLEEVLPFLAVEVEEASRALQCEIALLFVGQALAAKEDIWLSLGYESRTAEEIDVAAWKEAAVESYREGSVMLFKQLRADRVLRPI